MRHIFACSVDTISGSLNSFFAPKLKIIFAFWLLAKPTGEMFPPHQQIKQGWDTAGPIDAYLQSGKIFPI
jgi:hypothetical protein